MISMSYQPQVIPKPLGDHLAGDLTAVHHPRLRFGPEGRNGVGGDGSLVVLIDAVQEAGCGRYHAMLRSRTGLESQGPWRGGYSTAMSTCGVGRRSNVMAIHRGLRRRRLRPRLGLHRMVRPLYGLRPLKTQPRPSRASAISRITFETRGTNRLFAMFRHLCSPPSHRYDLSREDRVGLFSISTQPPTAKDPSAFPSTGERKGRSVFSARQTRFFVGPARFPARLPASAIALKLIPAQPRPARADSPAFARGSSFLGAHPARSHIDAGCGIFHGRVRGSAS